MSAGAPLAATETWRRVVAQAVGRCQCEGACGRRHAKSQGRCTAGLAAVPAARLFVAASDPYVDPERAWRLPVEQLSAWCGPCLDGARRAARPVPTVEGTADLLALLDEHRDPPPVARPASRAESGTPPRRRRPARAPTT